MNEEPRSLDQLKPADYNPRVMDQHGDISLTNSMSEFGDLSSVVENETTGNLVGGHQRIRNLMKFPGSKVRLTQKFPQADSLGTTALGYVEVDGTDIRLPYRRVAWPLEREQAANIAANYIQGQFLMPELAKITEKLKNQFPDLLKLTGQREDEIAQLLDQFGSKQESTEEGSVPAAAGPGEPAISQKGVTYRLGRHRLMCGDSASADDVDTLMQGRRAAMAFTDPPYNIGYVGKTAEALTIKNDKMTSSEFQNLLQQWCANLIRVTDGALYICMSPKELGALKTAFEAAGGHWHDYIIWVKDHFTLGGGDFQHQYEPILYGWPERLKDTYKTPERNETDVWEDISAVKADFDGENTRIKIQGFEIIIAGKVQGKIKRKKAQSDIWRFNRPAASREHPTMKPTILCAEAIKNSSTMDGIILDLFGGSGSTLIAAEETGRTCYMMELDEHYVDVIRKRFARLQGLDPEVDDWEAVTPAIEQPAPVAPQTPTQPEVSANENPTPTV